VDLSVGDGAHLTESLRDEQVGSESGECLGINGDDRFTHFPRPSDLGIDDGARRRGIERSGRQAR
jgi:hypothetical protein